MQFLLYIGFQLCSIFTLFLNVRTQILTSASVLGFIELDTIAGVITGPSGGAAEGVLMDKPLIVRALGSVAHFDDNPHHLEGMGNVGVLFPSDMPESQAAINLWPTVQGWQGVREFLTTPGLTLYGSGLRQITSPAVERKEYPKAELIQ